MNYNGKVLVVAYAYFDKDVNLKHFMFDGKDHYNEKMPDANTVYMLEQKLYRLHNISSADKDDKTNV